ncbi:mechanosensitive ion channel family protein [Pelagibius marinus]|uniref:mechanosensitive ion channel family protein n=1 Tax=Pelagibius marinus TaxID=2762760 RepID=UPI001872C7D1|nr:mechanosensitive ion channel domain-containing protein [Pelagibius marinus]
MRSLWPVLLLCLVLAFPAPQAAQGQAADVPAAGGSEALQELRASGQPLSEAAVRDLVARLDDAEVRQLLLERLDASAQQARPAAEPDMAAMMLGWRDLAEAFRANLGAVLSAVPEIPAGIAEAYRTLREQGSGIALYWLVLGFALMMLAGLAVEIVVRRFLRRVWLQAVSPDPDARLALIGGLLIRLVLEIIFLVAFVAGALALFFALWQGNELTRNVVMTYLTVVIAVRFFAVFSQVLLAPGHPVLRLLQIPDDGARYLHRQNIVMAAISAFGFLTCTLLRQLGMSVDAYRALAFAVGLILFGTLVYTILRARKWITGDLAWDREANGRWRGLFAEIWPSVAAGYVVLLYVVIVLVAFTGHPVSYLAVFGSLLTVLFVPHIDAILLRGALRLEEEKAVVENAGGQVRIVGLRAARLALYLFSVLFLLRIWGLDFLSLAQASVGSRIAGALVDIGLTALVAYVLWEMARIAIDRRLAAEGGGGEGAAEPGEQGGQGVSRIRTLLPLMRVTIQITIVVMAVMLVLSSLGVDIGPLLAGAGVVGLAVGFGAQTLVRDIVSGVFFLVDDAFRLGEYIDVGSVKGTVEKISLRSLRLRHHRGALHTIPFGEIQHLTNYSRDWAIMKLEFRVPFDTDLEKVRKIFKRIGQDLLKDEEMGPDFLEPFKSQGVLQTDDSAFVLRGKFMAKPGKQFLIRRAVFQEVQKAFAEEGIRFADRRVTVNVPGAEQMEPEERAAAEKAAASAVAAAEAQAAKS